MRQKIELLLENVGRLQARYNTSVTVVAATKTVDAERINLLPEYGITAVGENRVQEFMQKYPLISGLSWHFIGTLQTNKVKYLVGKTALIQSVTSQKLCDEIDDRAQKEGIIQSILIEVNIGGETTKTGVPKQELDQLLDYANSKKNIKLCGLMCIPPEGTTDKLFQEMHGLYERHKLRYGFEYLSMGMSGDYQRAIANGSNMIRIGSLIFGQRNK